MKREETSSSDEGRIPRLVGVTETALRPGERSLLEAIRTPGLLDEINSEIARNERLDEISIVLSRKRRTLSVAISMIDQANRYASFQIDATMHDGRLIAKSRGKTGDIAGLILKAIDASVHSAEDEDEMALSIRRDGLSIEREDERLLRFDADVVGSGAPGIESGRRKAVLFELRRLLDDEPATEWRSIVAVRRDAAKPDERSAHEKVSETAELRRHENTALARAAERFLGPHFDRLNPPTVAAVSVLSMAGGLRLVLSTETNHGGIVRKHETQLARVASRTKKERNERAETTTVLR